MIVSLIAAAAQNGVIGKDGTLPWRLSADLKRFKSLTTGHTILMGRKTYDSIGKPLPDRKNFILSRSTHSLEGCECFQNVNDALRFAAESGETEIFVIGGSEVYKQTLDKADRLYLTRVEAEISGDTYFPEIQEGNWELISSEKHPSDDKNEYPTEFCILERRLSE